MPGRFQPSRRAPWAFLLIAASLSSGCGVGTAGILGAVFSGGGGGGSSNAPPTVAFRVDESTTKTSPARLVFRLTDREGNDRVQVQLYYKLEGEPDTAYRVLRAAGNPMLDFDPSFERDADFLWDFASQLATGTAFVRAISLRVAVVRGTQIVSKDDRAFPVGNDPPVVEIDPFPSGQDFQYVVPLSFNLSDSSKDLCDVVVEYNISPGFPADGWRRACAYGAASCPVADDFVAFADVKVQSADRGGREFVFVWDSFRDLLSSETTAQLRVTPTDKDRGGVPVATGVARVTEVISIDNDLPPVALLNQDAFRADPTGIMGIPAPFGIVDFEPDLIQVVVQWKREGSGFEYPVLPETFDELVPLLADPAARATLQIATEMPNAYTGIVQADPMATTVRLPELASTASTLVLEGIVPPPADPDRIEARRRELDLLRPSTTPAPVGAGWRSNPLDGPVAALPLGDGITALVLDEASGGVFRLREIDLATGAVVRTIVDASPGVPTGMAFEPGRSSVIVAIEIALDWQVVRADLATGTVTPLAADSPATEDGRVKGIASLSSTSAVVTVGGSLIRLTYASLPGTASTVVSGLPNPGGVAPDPALPERVLVAQRDLVRMGGSGRIEAIDLGSGARFTVADVPRPESIAVEPGGARLLVVTDDLLDGVRELRQVTIEGGLSALVASGYASDVPQISAGPDGLRILPLRSIDDLAVGGGLEQRRAIVAYDGTTQRVTVERAFDPAPVPLQKWRIFDRVRPTRVEPQVVRNDVFVWDSRDVPGGGPAQLRVVPYDVDRGVPSDAEVGKLVSALFYAPLTVGSGMINAPRVMAVADMDADFDSDLIAANTATDDLSIFYQTGPSTFGGFLQVGGGGLIDDPESVIAADMNADALVDLVVCSTGFDEVVIFSQQGDGTFDPTVLVPGSPITGGPAFVGPISVAAGDVDGDGDQDLAVAFRDSGNLGIILQASPGTFDTGNVVNLDPGDTPTTVMVSDIDGDGRSDVLCSYEGSDEILLFVQSGGFGDPPIRLPVAMGDPASVFSADLDGDGDRDLVSADAATMTLSVFFQPAGGFMTGQAASLVLALSTTPRAVTAADVDGDGDVDIVAAADTEVDIFLQTAPGVFASAPVRLTDGSESVGVSYVVVTDVDGDGRPDIVVANNTSISVFLQSLTGEFFPAPDVRLDLTGRGPLGAATADLDGNGFPDLVSADACTGTLSVFPQRGGGLFPPAPTATLRASFPEDVISADLNRDELPDLAAADPLGVLLYFQGGRGAFGDGRPTVALAGFPGGVILSLVASDFDDDGLVDVAASLFGSDGVPPEVIGVYFQPAGGFGNGQPPDILLGGPNVTNGILGLATGDLDADGLADLVSANESAGTVTIFRRTGPGTFDPDPVTLDPIGGGSAACPVAVAVSDLDGDGRLDVAVADRNFDSPSIAVFFQPSGGFSDGDMRSLTLGDRQLSEPMSVVLADVDRDGLGDVLAAFTFFGGASPGSVAVFKQRLPRLFSSAADFVGVPGTGSFPVVVRVADLDSDGELDVVVAGDEFSDAEPVDCGQRPVGDISVFFGGR